MLPETLIVIDTLVNRLDALGIDYFIGGSVASSMHGIYRATNDADIIVDLTANQVDDFVAALSDDFYVDADMIHEALKHDHSFNVIHLPTMVKADLFPTKRTAFSDSEWRRRRLETIRDSEMQSVYIASAEDMILQKLNWYRLTGERSDRQWGDVQGMLKVQGMALDFAYMAHWAAELGLTDLLETALIDAGMEQEKEA
jgi:hypothetical protein